MFAGADGGHDHLRVQRGRGADIDNVDSWIGKQLAIIAIGLRDPMFLCECVDMVAARHHSRDLGIDAVSALVGVHVKLGDEAAADEANSYFCHCTTRRITCSASERPSSRRLRGGPTSPRS